ncbi:VanZ family protein [Sellimonas catena]|uniref:VanZ family protein n=1 Tax=Sellimonas catena TaxID=2994035 RepID=A0A9W6CEJ7_9FIRM|nr:VanZ family protein [Sellimonas catena]GLG91164.1 VanZ family protein [Sellimonas catena]
MKSKKFTMGLLIFYLIVLTWIIIFKLQFSFENLPHIRNINLIPFGESVIINGKMDFGEIIQNALAFIPFGVLMHVLWEEKPLIKQMAPVVAVSLLYEIIQFLFAVGATDITDVIANSLGGMIGIIIAVFISKLSAKHWIKIINTVSISCAIVLTAFIAMLILANM